MRVIEGKKHNTARARKKETVSAEKVKKYDDEDKKSPGKKDIYQHLIQNAGNVIICLSLDHKIVEWNREAERVYGWKREKVLGKNYFQLFTPEDVHDNISAEMNKVLKGESARGLESRILAKDRKEHILSWNVDCLFDNKGKPYGVIALGHDITGRKLAEDALKQSEKKYRDLVDNALIGVYKTRLKGDISYVNKALANIFEFKNPEEMMQYSVLKLYKNPADREIFIKDLKEKGKVDNFDTEIVTKSGKTRNIVLSATLDGNIISGMIMDITDRRQIRNAITKAKVEWEMTFDNAVELIILVDKELNVLRCNKRFADFAGKSFNEIKGHNFCQYLLPQDVQQLYICKKFMDSEKEITKLAINTDTGNWFNLNSRPVYDEKGKFLHAVVIVTDITKLKNTERRLLKSEKELKMRVEELEKFYDMSVGRELKMRELKKEIKELKSAFEQNNKDEGNER